MKYPTLYRAIECRITRRKHNSGYRWVELWGRRVDNKKLEKITEADSFGVMPSILHKPTAYAPVWMDSKKSGEFNFWSPDLYLYTTDEGISSPMFDVYPRKYNEKQPWAEPLIRCYKEHGRK